MTDQFQQNTPMKLVGMVMQAESAPSFGTPVFAHADFDHNFIQSSQDGKKIDDFVPVKSISEDSNLFRELRLNFPFFVGMPFMFGIVDYQNNAFAMSRGDMYSKLRSEFNEYDDYPFLQWTIVSLFNSERMLKKIKPQSLSLLANEFCDVDSAKIILSPGHVTSDAPVYSFDTKSAIDFLKHDTKNAFKIYDKSTYEHIFPKDFIRDAQIEAGNHELPITLDINRRLFIRSRNKNLKILRDRLNSSDINT